ASSDDRPRAGPLHTACVPMFPSAERRTWQGRDTLTPRHAQFAVVGLDGILRRCLSAGVR
ncbi:MAG TPA: hypothetical protein VHZ49_04650, partial [Methylomirabilota bacterium]|nr:hypothetical protein [Methylomirabilota bacterium]